MLCKMNWANFTLQIGNLEVVCHHSKYNSLGKINILGVQEKAHFCCSECMKFFPINL